MPKRSARITIEQVAPRLTFVALNDSVVAVFPLTEGDGALRRPDAAPTLFDDDLNPKPAYYAVARVLLDSVRKSVHGAPTAAP